MKRINYKVILLFAVVFLINNSLMAQKYSINSDHSTVKWEAKKVLSAGHNGIIDVKSAYVVFNDGIFEEADLVMDMNSIVCSDLDGASKERLEGHLKSDDFFSIEKFPESTFNLVKSERLDDSKYLLSGDLTIKGITHPLKFDLNMSHKDESHTLSGKISIDRTLYNVKYGSGKFFDNLGDKAISDIFTLDFVLYLEE